MNDLLSVIIDLSLENLATLNPGALLQDVSMFLNCFQLQSSKNAFRLYLAFPASAQLIFPIDDDVQLYVKRLALADVTRVIMERFTAAAT